jgi:hypothetical protein
MATKKKAASKKSAAPAKKRTARWKGISRIDQPEKHTHGWYVRVRYAGQQVAKFFPDKLNGGQRKALAAAVSFRDETERAMGKPRTDRYVVGRSRRSRKSTVGVRKVLKAVTNASGEVRSSPVYEVTWSPEPNVVQRTSVSIRKWGDREAYRRACGIRERKEQELYGTRSKSKA